VIVVALLWPSEAMDYVSDWIAYFRAGNVWQLSMGAVVVGVVFGLISLALLLLELSPRRSSTVELTQVTGGKGMLTTEAIVQRVKRDVEAVAQVQQAKPEVISRGKSIDIRLELHTDPDAEVSSKTEEVIGVVRDSVERGMGVRLRDLQVKIRHQAPPAGRAAGSSPSPASVEEAQAEVRPLSSAPSSRAAEGPRHDAEGG